ncbi:hypothetical protein AB0L40_25225 [Patulibacter sp. NPDC049589]|uniref:hypothetical protein n=1 Tax=Patulibacter sp. NPDC049589 TaxID=3154731 RepID=UPI00342D9C00
MSDAAAPGAPSPGADPVAKAKEALDAARESMAALVTVRARALQEARRLRDRAEAPEREALVQDAALQERRAVALEPRIEQLRDLSRRAEVAYEALRADRGADDTAPDDDPDETD